MSDMKAQSPYMGSGGYCGLHHRYLPCPVCTSAPALVESHPALTDPPPSLADWQLCPKCLGSKVQAAPPGVPPGQMFDSTSAGPWMCVICDGLGLIQRGDRAT